jgi:hypothetical protein
LVENAIQTSVYWNESLTEFGFSEEGADIFGQHAKARFIKAK